MMAVARLMAALGVVICLRVVGVRRRSLSRWMVLTVTVLPTLVAALPVMVRCRWVRLLVCWVIVWCGRRVSVVASCGRRMMRCLAQILRPGWIGGRCRTVRRAVCVVTSGGSVLGRVAGWSLRVCRFRVHRGTAWRRDLLCVVRVMRWRVRLQGWREL